MVKDIEERRRQFLQVNTGSHKRLKFIVLQHEKSVTAITVEYDVHPML